jgi:signal transduction histidine kinase
VTVIDLRRVPDAWRRLPITVRDAPLAVVLALLPLVPAFDDQGTQLGDLPRRPMDGLAVLAVALQSVPLAGRRRWPLACLALVAVGFSLDQLRAYHTTAAIGLPLALLSAGAHLTHHRRTAVLVASAAYVPLVVALDRSGSAESVVDFLTFYLLLAGAWVVGVWLRQSRAAEAERRRHLAESTRAAERTRIARELHDVVTHHVTAMVVQADAARYLVGDPVALERTFDAVSTTGRRAIGDLRHVLDLLDPDHGPEVRPPAVGDLAELVEQTRSAGQPVEYAQEGEPPAVAGGAEVAAYRVVQEGLTNALKHARGSRTSVRVRHGHDEIVVEVGTDGPGSRAPSPSPGGSGRGLTGLRDRVEVLGGELSAGLRTDGGFVVRARIPLGTAS